MLASYEHLGSHYAEKLNNSWICFLGRPEDDRLCRNMSPWHIYHCVYNNTCCVIDCRIVSICKKICCPTQHFNITSQRYMFRLAWTIIGHFFLWQFKNRYIWAHNQSSCVLQCIYVCSCEPQHVASWCDVKVLRWTPYFLLFMWTQQDGSE